MGANYSKLIKGICIRGHRGGRHPIRALQAPKGYVPVCVGLGDESKKFMVHTSSLQDVEFIEFLCISAKEYGFKNQGVLRIPCDTKIFEERMLVKNRHRMLKVITD